MRPHDRRPFLVVENRAEGTVVHFVLPSGVLDDSNVCQISEDLTHIVEGGGAGHLIVDLGNVNYLTSTTLGAFVNLRKQVAAKGGRLTLRAMRESVYEVFEVTKLTRLFDIRRHEAEEDGRSLSGAAKL